MPKYRVEWAERLTLKYAADIEASSPESAIEAVEEWDSDHYDINPVLVDTEVGCAQISMEEAELTGDHELDADDANETSTAIAALLELGVRYRRKYGY